MTVENTGLDYGAKEAAADLTGAQYHAVAVDANGNLALSGAGALSFGILQNAPNTGEVGNVRFLGVSKAVIGAAVNENDELTPNASGRLIPTAATADYVLAIALEAGAADGVLIEVALLGFGQRQTT